MLALTDSGLVMRLASTTFFDEEENRRVTQNPEGDYFLVWRKAGAAPASVAAPAADIEVRPQIPPYPAACFPKPCARELRTAANSSQYTVR